MNKDIGNPTYTTFAGDRLVASGDLPTTLTALRQLQPSEPQQLLTFVDDTGKPVDFDLSGSLEEVLGRYQVGDRKPGPGRPKLGVVSREISLLPRHWDWLAEQPAGASATLRRLVDAAAKSESTASRSRRAAAATGRVMTALAGDNPGFEEAYRALERRDAQRFASLIAGWPADVERHLSKLAEPVFEQGKQATRSSQAPDRSSRTSED